METYSLSEAEYVIMEFLWDQTDSVTLQEIIAYCTKERGYSWKQQTIYTFLSRMEQKGAVTAVKKGQKRYYSAAMTLEQLKKEAVHRFLSENFKGSLSKFLTAFTGGQKMTKEEQDVLKKFLEQ